MLLPPAGYWILSRWLLPHRSWRYWTAHSLRGDDCGVSAVFRSRGNDLITPHPEFDFPGLSAGDRWCLCVSRWKEALDAGVAPPVILEATHASTIEFVSLEDLTANAADIE